MNDLHLLSKPLQGRWETSRLVYILLSATFVIVNLLTLSHQAPWIDEVMFLDTSYNAAVHGTWETTAWYRVAGQSPFSTYPPFYQLVAAAWIWLFGGSLVAVRSLNLLVVFVLGSVCLRLMRRHRQRLTVWTVLLFTMMLWGTSEMAWMYRNGRPDMLCALLFVVVVFAIDSYLSADTRATRTAVVVASALLLCSGIQAAVCLCILWLFLFVAMKGRRRESVRLLWLLLAGLFLGLLLVSLFMLAHGRLLAFVSSIVQYSSTLSCIAIAVLPWVGEALGFDATAYMLKLQELTVDTTLGERLSAIVDYRSFWVLLAASLPAYFICFRRHPRRLLREPGFLSLLFALFVPVMMCLAGRFADYYRWMVYLPLLFAVVSIAGRSRWCLGVLSFVAVALTVGGIRSMCAVDDWHYDNLRSFVRRQHLCPTDAVVCPFSVFYEVKPVCGTCYFAGIYPLAFMGDVDYVIEAPGDRGFDRRITDYVDRLKSDTTVVLSVIDHCERPSLILYQIQKTHE